MRFARVNLCVVRAGDGLLGQDHRRRRGLRHGRPGGRGGRRGARPCGGHRRGAQSARAVRPQAGWNPARVAAMFNRRDQLFAICVVVLSAKLAKCDGPVRREEIDAFKRQFRIPPEAVRDIGRLFDQARDSAEGFEGYAGQLGEAFADNRGMLEDVLAALFVIARADGAGERPRTRLPVAHASRLRPRSGGVGSRARRHAAAADHPTNRTPTRCSAWRSPRAPRRSAPPGGG